jgi:uncharacterized membrane protein
MEGPMTNADRLYFAVKLFSAMGSGLVGRVFFAFSTFVMNALARLQPQHGIAAMQSINIAAINPLFMMAFVGTALACLFLAAASLMGWHQSGGGFILVGSLLYFAGTFLVTIVFNVPLNDALANVATDSPEGAALWTRYLSVWTAWNHVRTIAALAAATSFILALQK